MLYQRVTQALTRYRYQCHVIQLSTLHFSLPGIPEIVLFLRCPDITVSEFRDPSYFR